MTDPVLTIKSLEITDVQRRYPLATRGGVMVLVECIAGMTVWRDCTKPQQVLLEKMCAPLVAKAIEVGHLEAADLPVVYVRHAQMARALRRRGLVDDDGRLTARAVHAWYWARLKPSSQPVVDVHLSELPSGVAPGGDVYPLAVP